MLHRNLKAIIFSGILALSYGTDSDRQQLVEDRAPTIDFHMLITVEERVPVSEFIPPVYVPEFNLPPPLSFRERFGYEMGSKEWRRKHYYRYESNFVGFFQDNSRAGRESNKSKRMEIPREYVSSNGTRAFNRTQMNAYRGPYTVAEY